MNFQEGSSYFNSKIVFSSTTMTSYESVLIECLETCVRTVGDYEKVISTVYDETWNRKKYLAIPESRSYLFGTADNAVDNTCKNLFSNFVHDLCSDVYDAWSNFCNDLFISFISNGVAKPSYDVLPVVGYVRDGVLTIYAGYKYADANVDFAGIARKCARGVTNKTTSVVNYYMDCTSRADDTGVLVIIKIRVSDSGCCCNAVCDDWKNTYKNLFYKHVSNKNVSYTSQMNNVPSPGKFTCSDHTKKLTCL